MTFDTSDIAFQQDGYFNGFLLLQERFQSRHYGRQVGLYGFPYDLGGDAKILMRQQIPHVLPGDINIAIQDLAQFAAKPGELKQAHAGILAELHYQLHITGVRRFISGRGAKQIDFFNGKTAQQIFLPLENGYDLVAVHFEYDKLF